MKKLITFAALMVGSLFSKSQTTVIIEPPTNDAFIYQVNPSTNYGSSPNLTVGKDVNGDEVRTLIKWDLSSLPGCITVTNAEIRLDQWNADGPVGGDLYRITSSWSEGAVTWNNQPTWGNWYGTQTFSGAGLYFIPATNLVQDWLTYGNDGVLIKWGWGNNGEVPAFDSKEASSADPRLIVTYTSGTVSVPASSTVSASSGSTPIPVTSGGTWTASESCTWVSLSPTSGTGNGTVTATYTQNTSITRSCTITFSCGSSTDSYLLTQSGPLNGIEEISSLSALTLHPNPTTGEFILEMELTKPDDFEIKVVNVLGQVVYGEKLENITGKYQKTIDLNPHAKGVYNLHLITEEETATYKIILQ